MNILKYFIILTAIRQLVIIFDAKIGQLDKSSTYRTEGVVAILNSTSSTYVHMKNSNIEVDQIKVIFLKL